MLIQILDTLRRATDAELESRNLVDDNFTILFRANYKKVVEDFTKLFLLKGKFDCEYLAHFFIDPKTGINIQLLDKVVSDYLFSPLSDRFYSSIVLNNNSRNVNPTANPYRCMADSVINVGEYLSQNQIECFLPRFEFDHKSRKIRENLRI